MFFKILTIRIFNIDKRNKEGPLIKIADKTRIKETKERNDINQS